MVALLSRDMTMPLAALVLHQEHYPAQLVKSLIPVTPSTVAILRAFSPSPNRLGLMAQPTLEPLEVVGL